MFNQTITIINHYYDSITREDGWNKTILKGMWRNSIIKNVVGGKVEMDDSVSVTIPYVDGFVSPKDYAKLPNDIKKQYWTLDSTNNLDIMVLGEVTQTLGNGYTITNVKKDYDRVATISGVSDNTMVDLLKHWRVVGK